MPGQIPPAAGSTTPETETEAETKKGRPGSKATFPNGLKDVHDMAAAAQALQGLGTEEMLLVAERKGASDLFVKDYTVANPSCQPA